MNGPNKSRVVDIMHGFSAIAEVEFTTLQNLMQSIMAGKVEGHSKRVSGNLS